MMNPDQTKQSMKLDTVFLALGRPFLFYPGLCKRFPITTNAAVFLCAIGWRTLPDSDGWVEMSVANIQELTGLSGNEQRTARRYLKAAGLLEERTKRLEHLVFFRVSREAEIPQDKQSREIRKTHLGSAENASGERGKQISTVHKEIEKKEERGVLFPDALQSASFREAWQEWTTFRKEIRHSLTPSTIGKQLKFLAGLGESGAIASINQSIEKGWQGLFPPRDEYANPNNQRAGNGSGRGARLTVAEERNSHISNSEDVIRRMSVVDPRDSEGPPGYDDEP